MKVREFKNITSYEQIISIRKKGKNYRSFVVKHILEEQYVYRRKNIVINNFKTIMEHILDLLKL